MRAFIRRPLGLAQEAAVVDSFDRIKSALIPYQRLGNDRVDRPDLDSAGLHAALR